MSKSVLVIDTPESCDKCPLCYHEHSFNYLSQPKTSTYCMAFGDVMCAEVDAKIKPDWCPLSPLPPRKVPYVQQRGDTKSMTHLIEDIIGAGYNKCLDDLQKGVTNEE